jgi:hypothetical protein
MFYIIIPLYCLPTSSLGVVLCESPRSSDSWGDAGRAFAVRMFLGGNLFFEFNWVNTRWIRSIVAIVSKVLLMKEPDISILVTSRNAEFAFWSSCKTRRQTPTMLDVRQS